LITGSFQLAEGHEFYELWGGGNKGAETQWGLAIGSVREAGKEGTGRGIPKAGENLVPVVQKLDNTIH